MMNPFEKLGLAMGYDLSLQDLERAYFEAQRRWHPDHFAQASSAQRQEALENASLLNQAYQTLKDPVKRAEILLRLHGLEDPCTPVTPHVAMEAFTWRERLQEARDTPHTVTSLHEEGQHHYEESCRLFSEAWASGKATPQARDVFQTMAFYAKFVRECDEMLIMQPLSLREPYVDSDPGTRCLARTCSPRTDTGH